MSASRVREPDPIQRLWPVAEQPTSRLLRLGAAALSDAEILAILIRRGSRSQSAVDIARDALNAAGGLSSLLVGSPAQVLSPEATARLTAALEFARRSLIEELRTRNALTSPASVRDYLRLTLAGREHEVFVAVFLDAQHRVIACEELFRGTLTQTSVYPREVVKGALRQNAAAVIFAHNHPSGVAEPSHADEALTRSLRSALALVDIRVLDHFIVAGSATLSFAERGLL
jgi:DNA repair protein RadC